MSTALILVLVGIACAVFIAGILITIRRVDRKSAPHVAARRDEFLQGCAERGWAHEERNDDYAIYLPPFRKVQSGHNRKVVAVHGVTTGVHRGHSFLSGRFELAVGQDPMVNVAMIALPGSVPWLRVSRGEVEDRKASVDAYRGAPLGSGEIAPGFDVSSDDENFARAVMHAGMQEFLRNSAGLRPSFWMHGNWMSVDNVGYKSIDDILNTLDFLCDVYDRIPSQVWQPAR